MIDRRQLMIGAAAVTVVGVPALPAAASGRLKIGSLKFGSLSWLLETIKRRGLDKANGLEMSVLDLAGTGAARIALLSGETDVVVSDWPWAMRQRSGGAPLKFAPYSSALGAVMVGADSGIKSIADLKGKRLGVAGTAIDKSWILLRAYSHKTLGEDIAQFAEPVFGAPPLITEQMRQGRVDAALNFWTFSARLEGEGYKELITMADILRGLGIDPPPPLVGFVWSEETTAGKDAELAAFLKVVEEGNRILATSDEDWEPLKPLMRVSSQGEFEALRKSYRDGIPQPWSPEATRSADKLLKLLLEYGGGTLVGSDTKFDAKLFYGA